MPEKRSPSPPSRLHALPVFPERELFLAQTTCDSEAALASEAGIEPARPKTGDFKSNVRVELVSHRITLVTESTT